MKAAVKAIGSLALSAVSAPVILALEEGAQYAQFQVAAQYAAVAATSGLSCAFTVSEDGGTTYIAGPSTPLVVAPAANQLGVGTKSVFTLESMGQGPNGIGGNITHVKAIITNLDATNAATYAIVALSVTGSVYG